MENMDLFNAYPLGMSHEKHGLCLTPTQRVCHMENMDFVERLPSGYVTWKTWTLFNAYPPGMCHGKHGLSLTPTLRVCVTWKTWTLFNAYPQGMCHMENMDFH